MIEQSVWAQDSTTREERNLVGVKQPGTAKGDEARASEVDPVRKVSPGMSVETIDFSFIKQTVIGEGLGNQAEPRVAVRTTRHTFDDLVRHLVEHEVRHGYSSLEMFRRFLAGEQEESDAQEEWRSLFLMFLRTRQVRGFSGRF